jgi:hypothetical protein
MENSGLNYSTFPSYDQIKNKIVIQLGIAENLTAEYYIRPQENKLILARGSLIKLSLALSDYLYLIKDNQEKKYFCYFLINPENFDKMVNIGAVLILCKEIIYKLGITQIETAKLPSWELYKELE